MPPLIGQAHTQSDPWVCDGGESWLQTSQGCQSTYSYIGRKEVRKFWCHSLRDGNIPSSFSLQLECTPMRNRFAISWQLHVAFIDVCTPVARVLQITLTHWGQTKMATILHMTYLNAFSRKIFIIFIPPGSTKLKGGYTGFTLSICPSMDIIVSALYLQQYSSNPLYICTSYQATEGVSHLMFVSKFEIF